jgi:hypothetical protein
MPPEKQRKAMLSKDEAIEAHCALMVARYVRPDAKFQIENLFFESTIFGNVSTLPALVRA